MSSRRRCRPRQHRFLSLGPGIPGPPEAKVSSPRFAPEKSNPAALSAPNHFLRCKFASASAVPVDFALASLLDARCRDRRTEASAPPARLFFVQARVRCTWRSQAALQPESGCLTRTSQQVRQFEEFPAPDSPRSTRQSQRSRRWRPTARAIAAIRRIPCPAACPP